MTSAEVEGGLAFGQGRLSCLGGLGSSGSISRN